MLHPLKDQIGLLIKAVSNVVAVWNTLVPCNPVIMWGVLVNFFFTGLCYGHIIGKCDNLPPPPPLLYTLLVLYYDPQKWDLQGMFSFVPLTSTSHLLTPLLRKVKLLEPD